MKVMKIEDEIGYVGFFICIIIFVVAIIYNVINGF